LERKKRRKKKARGEEKRRKPKNKVMPVKEIPTASPVEDRISWARRCHGQYGRHLREEPEMGRLLRQFKEAARASRTQMVKAGVAGLCENCEKEGGGSCCGRGIEDRYSGILLLINLLLSKKLPDRRHDQVSCLFLGPSGCTLLARHVICINFICKNISSRIDSKDIAILQDLEGVELRRLFCLHERIRTLLKKC
jgi:hypothetical protein